MVMKGSDKRVMLIVVNLGRDLHGTLCKVTRCMYASQMMRNSNARIEKADHLMDWQEATSPHRHHSLGSK